MACPAPARIAAAVSGEDAVATQHAEDCARCASSIAEQRELIAAARRMAVPVLSESRRRALAAEVMASSDLAPARAQRIPIVLAVGTLAAAAAALFVLESHALGPLAPSFEISAVEATTMSERATAKLDPIAPEIRRPAELLSRDADFAREQRDWTDVVTLRDGELAIEARDREPVTVIAGDARVRIARSKTTVVARRDVIVAVHVFAGTAEVTRDGRRQIIVAGELWTPPAAPAETTSAAGSLEAFSAGWKALHAARYADAIAAFDRANDPVVAEDAIFWAAIASERAGNSDDAARRLRAFVERFPASPRLDAARAAIARVTP